MDSCFFVVDDEGFFSFFFLPAWRFFFFFQVASLESRKLVALVSHVERSIQVLQTVVEIA